MEPMEKMIVNDREGFYGWFGLGGSILQVHDSVYKLYVVVFPSRNYAKLIQTFLIFQWNPELKIGFGYIPTNLHWWEMNTLGGRLQKVTMDCVERKRKN